MEDYSSIAQPEPPTKKFKILRIVVYVLTALLYGLVNFHKLCPSIVAEDMAKAYNVSTSELSIFSGIYFYPYAVMQPISGLFADMFDPCFVVGGFGLLTSVGSIMCGLSHQLTIGIIGRFLVGIGTGPAYICCLRVSANWFKSEQLPLMLGILMAFSTVGGIIAGSPLSLFCKKFGWRVAFYTIGGFGTLLSLVIMFFTKGKPEGYGFEPVNERAVKVEDKRSFCQKLGSLFSNIGQVIRVWRFWTIVLFNINCVIPYFNVASYWGGPFLIDVRHYTNTETGNIIIFISIGLLVGSILLPVGHKIFKTKKWIMFASGVFVAFSTGMLYFHGDKCSKILIIVYFFVLGMFTLSLASIDYSLLTSYYSPDISGFATGIANFFLFGMVGVVMQISSKIISHFGSSLNEKGLKSYTWDGYKNGLWLFSFVSGLVSLIFASTTYDPDSKCCGKRGSATDVPLLD
ncbi:Major Facilitator Superfamily protein [Trichomonas vaginalis G3]|uniref:Lysosomal dipeptide transporter MFSD1 n=1 Tax=Trichomonas vaginalis (strain ATCC PRA-98 / G3) TaxID=412133 RepID=A2E136_TRIV3|nr:major facilitator superfamily transporter [Trichomonas vaginalis G3]EAY13668.1 Major Facilitator Superfamily protein [Trichomonas vaginalis G3]KAI5529942.1 Major Facilitator Superfamily [Trichomonas vaginalis G3]|eukprot:XP_001325891.1 major facilitator superfamily transporter [Trichomonas vaginalis G3]